jgi:hypothetical protein
MKSLRSVFFSSLFCIAATWAIGGCASSPIALAKEEDAVRVFSSEPKCDYKSLGVVSSNSGSTFWGTEGNYNATISYMKRDAYKMGANAIIIKQSATSSGSLGGSVNDLLGEAIFCKN